MLFNRFDRFRLALVKNHAWMGWENKMSWHLYVQVTLKQADADWLMSGLRW